MSRVMKVWGMLGATPKMPHDKKKGKRKGRRGEWGEKGKEGQKEENN